MPKTVFVPLETVSIAHVVRPLQVAKQLRELGVNVVFGMGTRYREIVERAGFEIRPLFVAPHRDLHDAVRELDTAAPDQHLPNYLAADLEALASIDNLDLVVSDFRFMLRFAAEHLGVPHVALVNGYLSPYYAVLPEFPEAIVGNMPGWIRRNRPLRKLANRFVPRQQLLPARRAARAAGLRSGLRSVYESVTSNSLTLICDLPEFTPQAALPNHFHFVGPILWEPDDAPSISFSGSAQRRPLVYATLGTSGDETMCAHLCEAFADSEYEVVLSTGEQPTGPLPANFTTAAFVRASEILQHAVLMVCHGGNGTIYQAIAHAVPMVCITSLYDQEWNAQRVTDLGIGEAVFARRATPTALRALADQVVQNASYKKNVSALAASMAAWNGAKRSAELIMDFMHGRDATN